MTQPQIEYEVYIQDIKKAGEIIMYDEEERPAYIKYVETEEPLLFTEWMALEMKRAVEQEDYEYAAQIRDEYKNNNI